MGYFYEDDELEHHGIKGQKWGVRRFQNADGTLTAAGRARYGDKADNVEKRLSKAVKYENKAANAKTSFGREWYAQIAEGKRQSADYKAQKADGSYNKMDLFGTSKKERNLASAAEARANIAQKLKDRAENETNEKKKKKIMEDAIKNLATAENRETYAKAYKKVNDAEGLINKGVTYFNAMKKAGDMKVSEAGRKKTYGDMTVESIGDSVLSQCFGMNMSGTVNRYADNAYRKKHSAQERWDNLAGTKKKSSKGQSESDVIKDLSKSASKRTDIDDEERELIRELERSNR